MHIEKQYANRQQSKRISELGIKGNVSAFWIDFTVSDQRGAILCRPASKYEEKEISWYVLGDIPEHLQSASDKDALGAREGVYPAYNVAELGVMMAEIDKGNIYAACFYNWHIGFWDCIITKQGDEKPEILCGNFECHSEAEVRADALIYLLENKLVAPEYCNSMLG